MKRIIRLGVLVSGQGTNLQAILEAIERGKLSAEVRIVISNVETAAALPRASQRKIPTAVVPHKRYATREAFEEELIRHLADVDLVVLAGFMRVLSPSFVRHYAGRILNIHPALLPAFPGTDAIGQAWRAGVKTTGVTVHLVDEGVDTGPVVLQREVPIKPGETLEGLTEKIHSVEHQLYPEAIQLFAEKGLIP